MKESDTRFSLKATLKSLFVLYGFLIWANLIWLVIWVRFWVEWTFKYTQLPCHAFWEYLKILFFQIVKYFGVQSGGAMQLPILKIRVGLKQKYRHAKLQFIL